jgi:PAS domain S-box-containing protein
VDDESRQCVARLADTFPVAVIATDAAGVVTNWSPTAVLIYGWTAHETIGRPIGDLTVHPLDAGLANEIMGQVLDGRPWAGRYHARTMNGNVVEVYVVDAPLYGPGGELAGIVGCSQTSLNTESMNSPRWVALRHVASEISQLRERERSETARRLHDDVGQMMAMIRMELEGMRDHDDLGVAASSRLERVAGDLDLAIRSLRDLTDELSLRDIDVWNLVIRLYELADDVNRRGWAVAECSVGAEVDDLRRVEPETAYAAYNVAREAVFNSMRHSSCDNLVLRLEIVQDRLVLEAMDNGVGIAGSIPGHGRISMEERVAAVWGACEIQDRANMGDFGTLIRATFPLVGASGDGK